ncbi:unnamed protein product [Rotaria sordida]|uniref:Prohibitin n=1 Tax=Rotaria sordida TaxID=392033 RepID=A0A815NCB4_9BILA|nr:unnamed protein product [Rotaria sordida]CAF1633731.1 unnamed protein product [Rotaria sordida]
MIHIIGMEIIQIHMIFMVQHSSHTLLQQNGFIQQVYLKYKQECLDEKHFRQHVFEDFQQETLCNHEAGQLYGLEKFWTFLKYSREKPNINSKLEEILKNYRNLEDFRVDRASFPQQFFPTKSNYTFEAIAAAVAKNSDTSNSLKPNEEFGVLGRIDIGLGIGGGVINSMLYNVDDGHQDAIFDHFQSVKLDVIEEGTHFMISWLHRPIIFDIRTRPRSVPSITEIKDIKARREQSTSGESFKICCTKSQFDAIELITQRTLISQRNSELLTERAAQFGLLLDDISIIRYDKKESRTEQSRQENVIAAEGDTRAADLIGNVLDEAGDDLIELRRIEATEDIANQLSKSRNSVYLPHGPQILLNITGAMQ